MKKALLNLLSVFSMFQPEPQETKLPWTVTPAAVKTHIRDDEYRRKKAIRERRHKAKMLAKLSKPKRKRMYYLYA